MSLDIYPKNVHDEQDDNILASLSGSNIDRTCQDIHNACKRFGMDEG